MMNALLVALGVALSATCSHALGEKIYLRDEHNNYWPMSTSRAEIGGSTRTPEAGSIIIGLDVFRNLLQRFIYKQKNNRMPTAHRAEKPVVDMTSPFQNDGKSSAYYSKRDKNLQNHPGSQPTQASIGTQGFADPKNPFKGKVYNSPMPVNAAPAPVKAAPVDYMSPFRNSGTSSAYFKNLDQNAHNFPVNQPTQEELGQEGFVNPADMFNKVYV
ncbi:uncharacterized protein LOC110441675 [Mizuhopecten yessoensis]|uniref:Uncharacterized protein n=1 Tax=Mizuhopecten yessoensis TaxID=6573 RepID=A0A210PIY6_MIZYE|nr:uncharacterized protein LOC110441675 [Mizuhopecten yessoensis]OWF36458.1 hypothetical protein KP79_PYT23014 [Mizuhopecten yessoensis]